MGMSEKYRFGVDAKFTAGVLILGILGFIFLNLPGDASQIESVVTE